MGNFSINHHSTLTVTQPAIHIDYVLDFAEIPTFQMFPGLKSEIPRDQLQRLAAQWIGQLQLQATDAPLPLELKDASFQVTPGAGGLPTVRVNLRLETAWSGKGGRLH